MKPTINCLPNELLIDIISRICVYDRINCRKVCIRWKQLSKIFLSDIKSFNFGHHLSICCDSGHKAIDEKSLTYYYDRVCKSLDETTLMKNILHLIPNVKTLRVYLRNESTVEVIKKYCTDIECLTLISFDDRVMLNAIPMITKFGKTLKHLKICDESRAIRRNGLKALIAQMLSHCTQLEIFHLFRIQLNGESCQMISDSITEISTQIGSDSIAALMSKVYQNLESIIIRESFVNLNRMRMICLSFVNIKKLYIESYSDCHDFSQFRLIGQMRRLEHLEINFMPKFYRDCISIDEELEDIFSGCRHLAKISFSNCVNVQISSASLIKLSACCLSMKHIHFWRLGDMTQVDLDAFEALSALTQLKYLTLDALRSSADLNSIIICSEKLFDTNPILEFIYLFYHQMTRHETRID